MNEEKPDGPIALQAVGLFTLDSTIFQKKKKNLIYFIGLWAEFTLLNLKIGYLAPWTSDIEK